MSTDDAWEEWGRKDPYFAVITHDKYRQNNITDKLKEEFFNSAGVYLNNILNTCRRRLDNGFQPKRALDFGCGVGRVCIPLAAMVDHVTAVDVADSMLKEARENSNKHHVENIAFLKSDDDLTSLQGPFDFIHSFIVFQHIPVERGRKIFANLLALLDKKGIAVIQLTYAKTRFKENYGTKPDVSPGTQAGKKLNLKRKLKNLFHKDRPSRKSRPEHFGNNDPEMQMNPYNVNELFFILQGAGIKNLHVEFTDHGGELGLFLYFQKPS